MSDRRSPLVTIVLTGAFLAIFVSFLAYRLAVPWDGALALPESFNTLPEGLQVTPILSYPGGLRDGDIVTEVEGVAPIDWFSDAIARDLARPDWEAGGSAAYTIQRDGQAMDIEQPLIEYPVGEAVAGDWGFWLFVFGNLLVALVAFSRKPDEPALRVYLLMAASTLVSGIYGFGFQLSDFVVGYGLFFIALNAIVFYPLQAALFLHFVLVFPRPQPWLAERRWVIPLVYLVPAGATILVALVAWPLTSSTYAWVNAVSTVGGVTAFVYPVLTLVAIIVSLRTARDPVGREQVRWVLFALVTTAAVGLVVDVIPGAILGAPLIDNSVIYVFGLMIPVSIAIAILRYRLFDIDVLIRRTTQYAIVTGLLVLVYFGSVIVLQRLFTEVTGQTSTLAVVLSTLLIAALFLPVRRRVQDVIDRRFFRRKYDAEKVLNDFAATVRDETDLEALTAELVRVIQDTMQPEFVSVWLAPESTVEGPMFETAEQGGD